MTASLLAAALAAAMSLMMLTLNDHARSVNHQELAYAAAQAQTERLMADCASGDCALPAGTQACKIGDSTLQVTAELPWKPRLWSGLTPAVGRYLIHLEIAANPLLERLTPCPT